MTIPATAAGRRLRIASQLSETFNTAFGNAIDDVEVIPVGEAPETLDEDIALLIASPARRDGIALPPRPAGWPFALQWVQLVSVGIDRYPDWLIDVPTLTNTRGASAGLLAEFALAGIFARAKRMPENWISSPDDWKHAALDRIAGQTLGIVGFGAIGQALAPRAQAMGMKVQAIRRSDGPLGVAGVERAASLEDLFATSDHVVLAAPATQETRHMINAAVLAVAKPGLHLVNLARGSLVDDEALLAALDNGPLAAATLDVTEPEPLPERHPFYNHPAIRVSPHTAVFTADVMADIISFIADNVARYRAGRPLNAVVDQTRHY